MDENANYIKFACLLKIPSKAQSLFGSFVLMSDAQPKQLPPLFVQRMAARWGKELMPLLDSLQETPPTSIRINPWKGAHLFTNEERVLWCEYGRYLPQRPAFVWDPLYHAGCYYAQEASSMALANAIDFSRDLRILDLCAAPGGKSSLLLSHMSENSLLVSNELVGKRVNVLYENLAKWGYTNSVVTCNRTSDFRNLAGFFDVVLVDAPCSGEGMFRKDDGAIAQWSPELVAECEYVQQKILDDAFTALAPGGILVYSTCTFEQQENEENIQRLYSMNFYSRSGEQKSDLEPVKIPVKPEWNLLEVEIPVLADSSGPQPGYYCLPNRVKGEGLFFTAVRKKSGAGAPSEQKANKTFARGKIKEAAKEQLRAIEPFSTKPEGYIAIEFDGAIHIVREEHLPFLEMISQNLYVRKLGTKCGALKGASLIPDHELAMSPLVADSTPAIEVDITSALQYQQRNAIPVPPGTPNGWVMIHYKGTNIGWAKNVGNRLNNHYPSEWRIRKDIREFEAMER